MIINRKRNTYRFTVVTMSVVTGAYERECKGGSEEVCCLKEEGVY